MRSTNLHWFHSTMLAWMWIACWPIEWGEEMWEEKWFSLFSIYAISQLPHKSRSACVFFKWSSRCIYSELPCSDCWAYLRLVPDEVDLRFGWFGWRRRGYADLGCFVWLLDQDVDQSLLFVGWREGRNVGHSRWRRRGRLDEYYLIMFLWGRRGWQSLLWRVVCGFWGWDMHVDVLVDYRCLCWYSVLWCGGTVSTRWGSTPNVGSWVCVKSSTSSSKSRSTKTTPKSTTIVARAGSGNSREWCEQLWATESVTETWIINF